MDSNNQKEIDEREIKDHFNPLLIEEILLTAQLFTKADLKLLSALRAEYQNNIYNFKKIFVAQFEFAVKTYF